jgi:hypothetical protein
MRSCQSHLREQQHPHRHPQIETRASVRHLPMTLGWRTIPAMNIERMAALANIAALIPGGYCAYGTWVLLHAPSSPAGTGMTSQSTTGLSGVLTSLFVAIGLIVLAAVLNLLAGWKRKPVNQIQQYAALQSVAGMSVQPPVDFDATEFFRLAYHSDWTADIEKRIRIAAHQNQPNDHETFYARFIGVGLVSYSHDITWAYIFKSQIVMLMELNQRNGIMPLSAAKAHYDKAAIDYPAVYANYSFDQWMTFVKTNLLVLHHPTDMLEITTRGKDFLKYLTHWGRYPDARKG